MLDNELEEEVKYYVLGLKHVEDQLEKIGADLIQPRIFEFNLLYDTQDGNLKKNFQYLRLRKEKVTLLTFKGPRKIIDGMHSRVEIEIEVSNFDRTKTLLKTLGYQVIWTYEKYRTTYQIKGIKITADELPFGDFIEIEGKDRSEIKEISLELGLKWDNRILNGYLQLFQTGKNNSGLLIDNLTFSEFRDIKFTHEMLGVVPADK
jgi:adenylate cyclase class 2